LNELISTVLIGAGGYGSVYLAALLDDPEGQGLRLAGVVEPLPENCSRLHDLKARDVPVFASLRGFYRHHRADLAVISSPIHFHCSQTCEALAHGSHVLCEKPPAATVQEVDRMIEARDAAGKWVAVGYQWSFASAIRSLKRDIRSGVFGAPKRLKSLCLWPRGERYYKRNDWAGRLRDDQGRWILDSPANNAMAHDLHNMLYLLGDTEQTSAQPVEVVAETYKANDIESFDTVAIRVRTEGDVEILFFGSHAVDEDQDPVFHLEFEGATVAYEGSRSKIIAQFNDGTAREYESPDAEPHARKLWVCGDFLRGRGTIPCGLEAARAHTVCINGTHESAREAAAFPESIVKISGLTGERLTWVTGLADVLRRCYDQEVLPSALGLPWAQAGRPVNVRDYDIFPCQTGS
jgi:predicted dehydrogenase